LARESGTCTGLEGDEDDRGDVSRLALLGLQDGLPPRRMNMSIDMAKPSLSDLPDEVTNTMIELKRGINLAP
jgi:hypothetical protein